MKIINIVGARPNFVKIAPLMKEMKKNPQFDTILVHTGQHYDDQMSNSFFKDLDIPQPDINLNVGSETHAVQTAEVMIKFEKVCLKEKPDLIVVVGDVNSTLACALVAVKLGIKLAHVEAGLRSFDRSMPEEINRILVDQISDYLFITEEDAYENLIKEGISKNKIYFVGNIMIDSLKNSLEKQTDILERLNLKSKNYGIVTLHRPSNVDDKDKLQNLLEILNDIETKLVWPMHPRTKNSIQKFNLEDKLKKIVVTEALGYLDFISLLSQSKFVLTDSGGIQEETTYLKIPCLTIRKSTERPITINQGTNILVNSREEIENALKNNLILKHDIKIPKYWDGCTASRIVKILSKIKRID